MPGLDGVKLLAQWLVNSIAISYGVRNPITGFASQNNYQLGDPNDPRQDAVVTVLEPVTTARATAIAGTPPTGSLKKTLIQIPMHHVDDGIIASHQDISDAMKRGEIPDFIRAVTDGVFRKLHAAIVPDIIEGFYQYSGAVNALPTGSASVIAAKTAISDEAGQGMYTPDDGNRVLCMEPTWNDNLLGVSEFVIASSVGQGNTMATGRLTPKYGFGQMAEVPWLAGINSTVGTATGVTVNGEHAAGSTTVSIVTAAGAGTVKKGSVFTLAGSTQRHRIVGKVTQAALESYGGRMTFSDLTLVNGTAQDCIIYPPLPAVTADTTAFTFLATHGVAGLGFHPMALATCSRRFPDYEPGTGWTAAYAQAGNMLFRVHTYGNYMQNGFAVDVCGGAALAVARYGSRVIRTAN